MTDSRATLNGQPIDTPKPPPALDPPVREFVDHEAQTWRRWLPRAPMPWRDVAAYEEQIRQLEQRRSEVAARRQDAIDRLDGSGGRDLKALAEWERSGRDGPRPEPSRPALEAELKEIQREDHGLALALDQVARERADHVSKHRSKLMRDAEGLVEEAHAHATRALAEFEAARAQLTAARQLDLWVRFYPAPEAGMGPSFQLLAGGLRAVLEPLVGTRNVAVETVFAALRGDIDWVREALTVDQNRKLEGDPRPTLEEKMAARDRDLAVTDALAREAKKDHDQARTDKVNRLTAGRPRGL